MVSKNNLLNSGIRHEREKLSIKDFEENGWPKRLYRKDFRAGKVFQTLIEQEEQFKEGWVESPADLPEEVEEKEEDFFSAFEDKKPKTRKTRKTRKTKKG
jgi:hypothetical protein